MHKVSIPGTQNVPAPHRDSNVTAPTRLLSCPAWCTQPAGHDFESVTDDRKWVRSHDGPVFGELVFVGGTETEGDPTVVVSVVLDAGVGSAQLDTQAALALSRDIAAAAAWVGAHQ